MADQGRGDRWGLHYQQRPQHRKQQQQQHPMSSLNLKVAATAAAVGSMLLMSRLNCAGMVIALTVATPLLMIFSPVLLPVAIALLLLVGGFLTSGGFAIAALSVLCWVYGHLTKKHQAGAKETVRARARIAAKAHDLSDLAQLFAQVTS